MVKPRQKQKQLNSSEKEQKSVWNISWYYIKVTQNKAYTEYRIVAKPTK